MKASDIIEKLKEYKEGTYMLLEELKDSTLSDQFGKTSLVHSHGGGEGKGEYVERVVHFIDHDVYLRLTGFYSSYHGTDWENDWTEVKLAKKTITVYE